jgi:hypothetical protein
MKKIIRTILLAVLALVVATPLSIIITVLLFPLWSWLESSSGIESVGHSGPAGWCYLFIFMALLAALASTLVPRFRSSRSHPFMQAR